MFGWLTRLLLVRVLGRRLIPILTVVELVQLVRRRREDWRQTKTQPRRVGPARARPRTR